MNHRDRKARPRANDQTNRTRSERRRTRARGRSRDGDLDDGNVVGLTYIHDIVVRDDPRLERPVGYVSYWDTSLWALDLSDPTDISELGHFERARAHYAEPAPTFVDGKRIVVAGQETPSQTDGSSGHLYLVDADGLDDGWDGGEN